MGWTPRDVDACSLWEFLAARDGWVLANSLPDQAKPPTPEEHDAMLEKWA
jgi:hypothetical protein